MRISSVTTTMSAKKLRETLETHAQTTASAMRAPVILMAIASAVLPMDRTVSVLISVPQEFVNFNSVDPLLVLLIRSCQVMKRIKQPWWKNTLESLLSA
jgi:hypothetical protein